jgi:hypothetical protein
VIPVFELTLESRFFDGERRSHEAPKLHTVILEPEVPRVSLVWHSAMECHAKAYRLAETRIEWRADGQPPPPVESLLDLL